MESRHAIPILTGIHRRDTVITGRRRCVTRYRGVTTALPLHDPCLCDVYQVPRDVYQVPRDVYQVPRDVCQVPRDVYQVLDPRAKAWSSRAFEASLRPHRQLSHSLPLHTINRSGSLADSYHDHLKALAPVNRMSRYNYPCLACDRCRPLRRIAILPPRRDFYHVTKANHHTARGCPLSRVSVNPRQIGM